MRSARGLLVLLVLATFVVGAACGHTHAVEPPERAAPEEHAARPSHVATISRDDASTGIPLATSRAALLKPGAAKLIQERLVRDGSLGEHAASGELDGATRAALARFQRAHDLPATGDPDGQTVAKLGLAARDVFVSGR